MAGQKQARKGGPASRAGRPQTRRTTPGNSASSTGQGTGSRIASGRGTRNAQGSAAANGKPRPGQARDAAAGQAAAKRAAPGVAAWLVYGTWILSLAGLGLSIYLTIAHYTQTTLAGCPANATFNCAKVTTSPESMIFGIFPVAVLGLAFYVFMVAINTPWAWRSGLDIIRWARLAGIITGIAFVLYLVYVELLVVDAICLYCTAVHVITFLLFGLIMFNVATWNATTGKAARR
jgi:uncharacterized membrane protein